MGNPGGVDPDTHVTLLALLTLLAGIVVLVGGLAAAIGTALGTWASLAWLGPWATAGGWVGVLFTVLAVLAALLSLPAVLAGIGLFRRSSWARGLTFVIAGAVGLLALVSVTFVPLVYSAYAFWVLTRDEVRHMFEEVEPAEAAQHLQEHGGVHEPPGDR